jgi:hypothetical protein
MELAHFCWHGRRGGVSLELLCGSQERCSPGSTRRTLSPLHHWLCPQNREREGAGSRDNSSAWSVETIGSCCKWDWEMEVQWDGCESWRLWACLSIHLMVCFPKVIVQDSFEMKCIFSKSIRRKLQLGKNNICVLTGLCKSVSSGWFWGRS